MACRKISDSIGSLDVVCKGIDVPDSWGKEIVFPTLECIQYNDGELQRFLNTIPRLQNATRQAIIQQYNEYLIFNDKDNRWRNILAPQLTVVYDVHNLPILVYPRFEPLVSEDIVWKTPDHLCMIRAGQRLKEWDVSIKDINKFYDEVTELCSEYDLVEDDIIRNPSNIGYNEILGLRLIDYGLVEDDALVSDA